MKWEERRSEREPRSRRATEGEAHPARHRAHVPAKRGRPKPGLMLGLAVADLRHERVLNLCIVLALTAVLAPLLILFGLKHGAIQMMRNRLIEDPRNREIRPVASQTLERDWFDKMRNNPRVGFVTPMTRRIAAGVSIRLEGDGDSSDDGEIKKLRADLIPTGAGDALLTQNNTSVPGEGQCVLSTPAAEESGAKPGDRIEVLATRIIRGRTQTAIASLEVVGIAAPRASGLRVIYSPLRFLEQVERYKDGLAVPDLGWAGSLPEAYPVFDGAVFVSPKELPRNQELGLVLDTGFTKIENIPHADLQTFALGYLKPAPEETVYLLMTQSSTIPASAVRNLERETKRIGGKAPVPWVRAMSARLPPPVAGDPATELKVMTVPSAPAADSAQDADSPAPPSAAFPEALAITAGDTVQISIDTPSGALKFPVIARAPPAGIFVPDGTVALAPEIAGILRLGLTRSVSFEPEFNRFVLQRRGYSSFRLYAKTIDDVPLLAAEFEENGMSVFTEAERIRDVREIDTYATYVFLLIAAVGIVGATAALMASLYAAAERTRKELSVLRLLGVARAALLKFPIYQAGILVTLAIGLAAGFFYGVAAVINHYFQELLVQGERVCYLPPAYLAIAWGGGIAFAAMASLFAAARIAGIDPSEALRDE